MYDSCNLFHFRELLIFSRYVTILENQLQRICRQYVREFCAVLLDLKSALSEPILFAKYNFRLHWDNQINNILAFCEQNVNLSYFGKYRILQYDKINQFFIKLSLGILSYFGNNNIKLENDPILFRKIQNNTVVI